MSSSKLREVAVGNFRASFWPDADGLRANLSGNADMDVYDAVRTFMLELHEEAEASGAREVIADIRELEFISSSCLKVIVTWIDRIRGLAPERRYLLRFISDPRKPWQRRSLNALSCFAVDLIKIDV